jgi:hypothetical protein
MGLDRIGLEVVIDAGETWASKCARRIAPIRKDGNLLLCTLLIANIAVNSLISIILSDLTSGLVGFFVSTVLIVIFGDIIPQAVCSRYALQVGGWSRPSVVPSACTSFPCRCLAWQPWNQQGRSIEYLDPSVVVITRPPHPHESSIALSEVSKAGRFIRYDGPWFSSYRTPPPPRLFLSCQIGSRTVWLVRGIEFLLWPVAKPLAVILDWTLGEELGTIHSRRELQKLLDLHVEHGCVRDTWLRVICHFFSCLFDFFCLLPH